MSNYDEASDTASDSNTCHLKHKHMEDPVDRRLCSSNSENQKPNNANEDPRRHITWLTGSVCENSCL